MAQGFGAKPDLGRRFNDWWFSPHRYYFPVEPEWGPLCEKPTSVPAEGDLEAGRAALACTGAAWARAARAEAWAPAAEPSRAVEPGPCAPVCARLRPSAPTRGGSAALELPPILPAWGRSLGIKQVLGAGSPAGLSPRTSGHPDTLREQDVEKPGVRERRPGRRSRCSPVVIYYLA